MLGRKKGSLKQYIVRSYLSNYVDAERYLDEAEKIVTVTHGKSHPIYSDLLHPLILEIQIQLKNPVENGHSDPASMELTHSG